MKLYPRPRLIIVTQPSETSEENPKSDLSIPLSQDLSLEVFKGPKAKFYWKNIAALRIEAFKDFPYLYEGSLAYEKEYLDIYFNSNRSSILLLFDKDEIVGFSSSIPLEEEMEDIKHPFLEKGIDLQKYFYIGEVIITPSYRGKHLWKIIQYHKSFAQKMGILS